MSAAKSPQKLIIIWISVLIFFSLVIPTILVKWVQKDTRLNTTMPDAIYELSAQENPQDPILNIPVLLSERQETKQVPLELYVRGVVAAEMPAEFELEALKAQAIAARTYILHRIIKQDFVGFAEGMAESPPATEAATSESIALAGTATPKHAVLAAEHAWVTNTTADQAFLTEEQLREQWKGREYAANMSKINQAVAETRGLIITYEGEPIDAAYFSTSNGYTENSEEYWSEKIPYLRSVASPWDKELSPKYRNVVTLTQQDFLHKLGLPSFLEASEGHFSMEVVSQTSSGRIHEIRINGEVFTGREVREKAGLPSSAFTWQLVGEDSIEITTYGYGHGVGMSQYGANGLALEGRTAEEILFYYYQGVVITHMDQINGWQQFAAVREAGRTTSAG